LKHDVDVTVGHVMELVAVNAARLRNGGSSCFVLLVSVQGEWRESWFQNLCAHEYQNFVVDSTVGVGM
jgi:hypothetical protein